MIRTIFPDLARSLALALLLASVAWGAAAQATAPSASNAASESAIGLILPGQKSVFAVAARAVRLGFFAAHEAGESGIAIHVMEVDDDEQQLHAAIDQAQQRGIGVVVGPLPRAAVNALIDGGHVAVPLVALNYPERDAAAPPTMIAVGLSAEAEAQHVVRMALADVVAARRLGVAGPRFIVLAGGGALERRIAQAYVSALRSEGEAPQLLELAAEPPDRLAARFDVRRHDAVFLAMDAREAALVRARIPRSIPTFGTSLLNTGPVASSPEAAAMAHDLDGIRFVDMPWLLKADDGQGVLNAWPLPTTPMSPEFARLYALGVDAYRLALRWRAGETAFTMDGMTGHLRVDRANGPRVERTPVAAIYRNGMIERDGIGR
jgi:uncharacterized protein